MTRDEIRERFLSVVARAMAKPLSELPYRAPVTSRYHYGNSTSTFHTGNLLRAAKRPITRANPAALPGPTSMDSR